MANGGLDDILLTYNIIGSAKLKRIAALHNQIKIGVVADSVPVIEGYAKVFPNPDHLLNILVE